MKHTIIITATTVLAAISCKSSSKHRSSVQSLEDGGCNEYESEVRSLQSQRESYLQRSDADANAGAPFALYEGPQSNSLDSTTNDQPSQTLPPSPPASYLSDVDRQIAAAQSEHQKCIERKFGESATKKGPETGNAGHCDFNSQSYDILNYNCHSAANQSVRQDPKNTGIISCAGDQPVNGSPAYHTFNYRRENGMIVYYNWGKTCRAPLKAFPPDLDDPDHRLCAEKFCYDQYDGQETKPLQTGELVEEPGPNFCAANTKAKQECDACCKFRGTYWDLTPDPLRPNDQTFVQFMSTCYNACSQTFR